MKTIQKKTTGYKEEGLKDDILQPLNKPLKDIALGLGANVEDSDNTTCELLNKIRDKLTPKLVFEIENEEGCLEDYGNSSSGITIEANIPIISNKYKIEFIRNGSDRYYTYLYPSILKHEDGTIVISGQGLIGVHCDDGFINVSSIVFDWKSSTKSMHITLCLLANTDLPIDTVRKIQIYAY